jgi:hypothetical protein
MIIEEYVSFSNEKINYIENICNLVKDGNIYPSVLNSIMSEYYSTSNWILRQYEIEMIYDTSLKQEYDVWWSEKFIEKKKEMQKDLPKSIKLSGNEIDIEVKISNKEKYLEWQNKLLLSDRKVSTLRRLNDNWKNMLQILITLSSNSRSEMKALGIENIANSMGNKKKIKVNHG